jgi:hypothetical protein
MCRKTKKGYECLEGLGVRSECPCRHSDLEFQRGMSSGCMYVENGRCRSRAAQFENECLFEVAIAKFKRRRK